MAAVKWRQFMSEMFEVGEFPELNAFIVLVNMYYLRQAFKVNLSAMSEPQA